jgi:signal peptidase II
MGGWGAGRPADLDAGGGMVDARRRFARAGLLPEASSFMSTPKVETDSRPGGFLSNAGLQMSTLPRSRYVVFFSIALGGALTDLATKAWIFAKLGLPDDRAPGNVLWLINGIFGFQTSLNKGALFGWRMGLDSQAVYFFAGISVLAGIAIVIWLFPFGAAWDRWVNVALASISAGIMGNLYDRLGLWAGPEVADEWRHAVRDWILFKYGNFHWPNFNIADSMLVCGVGILAWHAFHAWYMGIPQAPIQKQQPTA